MTPWRLTKKTQAATKKKPAAADESKGSVGGEEDEDEGEDEDDSDAMEDPAPKSKPLPTKTAPKAKAKAIGKVVSKGKVLIGLADETSRKQFRSRIGTLPSKSFSYANSKKEIAKKDALKYLRIQCKSHGYEVPAHLA